MCNISKVFPGLVALNGVNLTLHSGRVHSLLGQNGSGKSTLVKILAGYHQPEAGGLIRMDGEEVRLSSSSDSRMAGIRMVHQELDLIPSISVADNIALTTGYSNKWWVSDRREASVAERVLGRFGVDLNATRPVSSYPRVLWTLIAIARALREDDQYRPRVLVLDEPTASLPAAETKLTLSAARHAADEGLAVLFISHSINEVINLSDDVTVLRDGRVVAQQPVEGLTEESIIELVIGSTLAKVVRSAHPRELNTESATPALRCWALSGPTIHNVSLNVTAGEIVGLSGVLGSGREDFPYLIAGAANGVGHVEVLGTNIFGNPRKAMEHGLVFVPGDRRTESAVPLMTVRENLTLPKPPRTGQPFNWMSDRRERRECMEWMERLDVRPRDTERILESLSGGNQQKVVLARALRCNPRVLVLHEPTQGVDVGTRAAIYRELRQAAMNGLAIIVSSSDSEELEALADRVCIFQSGRIVRTLTHEEVKMDTIDAAVLGASTAPSPSAQYETQE